MINSEAEYNQMLSDNNEYQHEINNKLRTFKGWEVLEVLPKGWKIDTSCGSPLNGFDFCTDGKSVLRGGKRALVRSIKKGTPCIEFVKSNSTINKNKTVEVEDIDYTFPSKTVNLLARKKFQEHILKEIMFDFMVCDIEGWDKTQYIKEIQSLINGLLSNDKCKKCTDHKTIIEQIKLF